MPINYQLTSTWVFWQLCRINLDLSVSTAVARETKFTKNTIMAAVWKLKNESFTLEIWSDELVGPFAFFFSLFFKFSSVSYSLIFLFYALIYEFEWFLGEKWSLNGLFPQKWLSWANKMSAMCLLCHCHGRKQFELDR